MSFNVSNFKSQISSVNGVNGSNKFIAVVTTPPALNPVAEQLGAGTNRSTSSLEQEISENTGLLQFLCDSANIPGKTLEVLDYKPQGFGKTSKVPYGISFDNLTLTFMIDSRHTVLNLFELWMQNIVNTSSSMRGEMSTYRNRTPFEIAYKSTYATTVELIFFNESGEYTKYTFYDAYPVQTGSVQLAWEANDQIAKLPVEFTYSSYSSITEKLNFGTANTRGSDYIDTGSYRPSGYGSGGTGGGIFGNIQNTTDRLTNQFNGIYPAGRDLLSAFNF